LAILLVGKRLMRGLVSTALTESAVIYHEMKALKDKLSRLEEMLGKVLEDKTGGQ
jgi:hypothetical protein